MKRYAMVTTQSAAMVTGVFLLVGGGVWGMMGGFEGSKKRVSSLPENLQLEALREQVKEEQSALGRTMRESWRNEELTEAQRRELRRNMRTLWTEETDSRADEYYAAADEDRNVVLDRHIDEYRERMTRMREGWEQRRKEREAERKRNGEEPETEEARRQRWRSRMGGQTTAQRKARSESRSPDSRGRQMAYFGALRTRASERGIELWGGRGSGGGRGGRGGGGRPHP